MATHQKKEKKQYNEAAFLEVLEELEREMKEVAGKGSFEQPRFLRFRVVDEIQDALQDALKAFEQGNFQQAGERATWALQSLQARQRFYFRQSPDKYFVPFVERAREDGVDEDLLARINKKLGEINIHWRANERFDLEVASRLYWAAQECLDQICDEHQARLDKAERAKIEKIKAEAEKKLEATRQAQAEHDARKAAERAQKATSLRARFAELTA